MSSLGFAVIVIVLIPRIKTCIFDKVQYLSSAILTSERVINGGSGNIYALASRKATQKMKTTILPQNKILFVQCIFTLKDVNHVIQSLSDNMTMGNRTDIKYESFWNPRTDLHILENHLKI